MHPLTSLRRFAVSTRGRLTLIQVAVLTVGVAIAAVAVYITLSVAQRDESDGVLSEQARFIIAGLDDGDGKVTFRGGELPGETEGGVAVDAAVVVRVFSDAVMRLSALAGGIDVDHHAAEVRQMVQELMPRLLRDRVPLGDGQPLRHAEAHLDVQSMADPARPHIVDFRDAGNVPRRVGDCWILGRYSVKITTSPARIEALVRFRSWTQALWRRRLKVLATSAAPPLYRLYIKLRTRPG